MMMMMMKKKKKKNGWLCEVDWLEEGRLEEEEELEMKKQQRKKKKKKSRREPASWAPGRPFWKEHGTCEARGSEGQSRWRS